MMQAQLTVLSMWYRAGAAIRARLDDPVDRERGEVTATTAIIVQLVAAAIAAGGVIAAVITSNANNVPSP